MIERMIGKRIYVVLKNNRRYTGDVQSVEGKLILINDKFGQEIYISTDEISFMEIQQE